MKRLAHTTPTGILELPHRLTDAQIQDTADWLLETEPAAAGTYLIPTADGPVEATWKPL